MPCLPMAKCSEIQRMPFSPHLPPLPRDITFFSSVPPYLSSRCTELPVPCLHALTRNAQLRTDLWILAPWLLLRPETNSGARSSSGGLASSELVTWGFLLNYWGLEGEGLRCGYTQHPHGLSQEPGETMVTELLAKVRTQSTCQ